MKVFAVIIMLVALYLLYRIAYPPKTQPKKGDEISQKPKISEKNTENAVGKSRYNRAFVHPNNGQSKPTPATPENSVKQDEKANIFAAGNGNSDAVIPVEKLDEIFGNPPEPETENVEVILMDCFPNNQYIFPQTEYHCH